MQWYSGALASLWAFDAQKNPLPAVTVALGACLLLYLGVGWARQREDRRTGRGRPRRSEPTRGWGGTRARHDPRDPVGWSSRDSRPRRW